MEPDYCLDCLVLAEEAAEDAMLGWAGIMDYYNELREGCVHEHSG
jgi:hypothetical protein